MEKKDGTLFLEEIKEKLSRRIAELSRTLKEGENDIAGMQEYYWDN